MVSVHRSAWIPTVTVQYKSITQVSPDTYSYSTVHKYGRPGYLSVQYRWT